ncbi:MAG: transglycosylase SLT domain-containing protein [Lautropia sp.]|nr:transglycosylase SLT domain-containing protein [Lautropia sp.]
MPANRMLSIESADPVRQSFMLTDLLAGLGLVRFCRSHVLMAVLAGSAWLMATPAAEARVSEAAPVVQRTTPSGSKAASSRASDSKAVAGTAAAKSTKKAAASSTKTKASSTARAKTASKQASAKRSASAEKSAKPAKSTKAVAANRASAGKKLAKSGTASSKRAAGTKAVAGRSQAGSQTRRLSNREQYHAAARKVALADNGPIRLNRAQRGVVQHISRKYRVKPTSIERYVSYAYQSGRAYNLDPYLILAVMATESSFNPKAESRVGAQGLMQVHTRMHKDRFKPYGSTKMVWQPRVNIQVGTSILADYIKRYGSERRALKAYVGAANLSHDFGYGRKVLKRRDEFLSVSVAARNGGPSQAAASQAGRRKTADL